MTINKQIADRIKKEINKLDQRSEASKIIFMYIFTDVTMFFDYLGH